MNLGDKFIEKGTVGPTWEICGLHRSRLANEPGPDSITGRRWDEADGICRQRDFYPSEIDVGSPVGAAQ